ncbi:DUF1566 domain-containing protein [bacterium]|nr:DUF1566 domain-containing protein [bacterium]
MAPGTPTTHTLNEIVALAPVQDNTHGATVSDVLSTKTFWGLSSGAWGLQTGTVTTGNNVTGSEGATSVIIPDGIYTGSKTATFQDADLVSSNIKAGVDLYGVTGNIPVTDRFTDHGDGTITDHKTGLMWMKNVRHTDSCLPEFARIYCETFTFAGYSDWRVPSIIELCHLIDQTQTRPALPSGHPFTIDNSSILIISRSVTAASGSGREEVSYLFLAGGHIADSRWYESNDSYLTAGFLWPVRTAL